MTSGRPDIEPSAAALDRIAAAVSLRIDRSRRRSRLAFGLAASIAAILVVAGISVAIQPTAGQVGCYAASDPASLTSNGDLESGEGTAAERALIQCTTVAAAADSRQESTAGGSSDSAAPGADGSGDASSSTMADSSALPEYLVCRTGDDYGVLTLDPTARIDPLAACAAIGMQPAE
ncbi:hypothetical protein [Naasia lichenicola]|uniref:Uncharacterized protein n=1 Tax=Naasia lichenicola TaxID=2565933 RepID=A0A4S4FNA4_9MICO|nr:hypothetical protein [Naasia lichenicola]THG31748.1 hypothetical protein E6C64_06720 [Naasia lichenicola]